MPAVLPPRAILDRLVAFPTVSRDSNLAIVDWIEGYLAEHGIPCTRVPNPDGTKAALYAHTGPQIDGGVVLSGHTDVVPVDGQDWVTDPFEVVEKDGKLFGRGTCDMKGFDALAIAAMVDGAGRDLARPLQIALSYDEEVGCVGAPPMIDHMVAGGMPRASTAIIGEPSMMKVVTGHKGGIGFDVHMRGYEVHSSIMHRGVSAIMEGARLIDWCNRMNAEMAAASPSELAAQFDPPWTTAHVGMISGGTAHNITAKDCHFVVSFRLVAGDSMADWDRAFRDEVTRIAAEMAAIHPSAGIDIDPKWSVPALQPEPDGPAEALARQLTGDNATRVVSYGTEAGQFQERGYSAIVCGPGDIAQAHQPNEYITVDQFDEGQRFMSDLLNTLAA